MNPSVWVIGGGSVTYPGSEGGTGNNTNSPGVNSPVLGDHLTSWDRKSEGSNRLHTSMHSGGLEFANRPIPGSRVT